MLYRIVIEEDEDGEFVAECPSLPGCISQGHSRDEAVANIKDAIAGYLASLKKHGEPIPLPVCSGQQAIRAFSRLGYQIDHQTGSHIILRHPNRRRLTVPDHRELAKGTLRSLIREAGLTKDQFVQLL